MATVSTSKAGVFSKRHRRIVFGFHLTLALSMIGTWACRLSQEPKIHLAPITEAEGPSYQYGYKYETQRRFDWNRQYYLCIVNTVLEIPLTTAFLFTIVQFLRSRWQVGALLLAFLVETVYWTVAFAIGLTFHSFTNIFGGGIIMGFCAFWDIYLLVMYWRQKKSAGHQVDPEKDKQEQLSVAESE
ncbi:hypothetical protein BDZ85DRAFT_270295 [Elsinoe ampelina]|uniref:Uncharacterized protein n=1 Tax=Elsinoe ampelina TaxID=302913 RepID=A0A6A6FYB2_9PEZI|nr:hypothetical protein BDZ85DRAFT_270295 [Elsinoe ampelina]